MKAKLARSELAEVSESQWGLVTSAQARARGLSHMDLSRLSESGDLVRLAHGVYRDAGAPTAEHESLRAAWLSTDPRKLAYERLSGSHSSAVVSGESAAKLHGIGDFRAGTHEFTTSTRRQTQRDDVHFRTRVLPSRDVTVRDGLPVTTVERTIADLVESRRDRTNVGDALRDASRATRLDVRRLEELLGPLAARNGHDPGDGGALLNELLQAGGIDAEHTAAQIVAVPELGALVAAQYAHRLPKTDLSPIIQVLEQLKLPSATHVQQAALQQMAASLSKLSLPTPPDVSALARSISASRILEVQSHLLEQINAFDWQAFGAAIGQKGSTTVDEA